MKVAPRARWYVRVFQFSPLVAGALLAFVLLAVPSGLRAQIDQLREFQKIAEATGQDMLGMERQPADIAERYFEDQGRVVSGHDADSIPVRGFQSMCADVLNATAADHAQLFDTTGTPVTPGWPADDKRFEDVVAFEEQFDAEVSIYFIPDPPRPSLVASSVPRPALLPSSREILEFWYPPYAQRDGLATFTEVVENPWLAQWVSERGYALHPTFDPSYGSGGGTGDDVRMSEQTLRLLPSGSYFYFIFSPALTPEQSTPSAATLMSDDAFFTTDPTGPDYQSELDRVADEYRADIFVAGPVQITLVPLRTPTGAEFRTKMLADELWPPPYSGPYNVYPEELVAVPEHAQSFTDGRAWMLASVVGGSQASLVTPSEPDHTWTAPQSLFVVATFNENPNPASASRLSPLPRAWRAVQVFIALNQSTLLASAGLLLAMALVAAPAAFLIERRRITQALVLEEMGRVQQDAHDKVYNRLSALSKRVEIASEAISSEVSRSLDGVAEDIRDTVTDLQEILGDARQRTASLTGKDPLRSQLESVAREQATRLCITVDLTVADALPSLSGQIGWDLQCVLEEAINNAVEHGGSTRVVATVTADSKALTMRVSDNGSGMVTTDLDDLPGEHIGLRSMASRAERHGGTFSTESGGAGATVEVRIPFDREHLL